MSYYDVENAIKDIGRYITAADDPVAWDIAVALNCLAGAIHQDFQSLRSDLAQIEKRLEAIERARR